MTLDDILRESLVPAPNSPVTLIGGVIVFCDLGTTRSRPLMNGIQRLLWVFTLKVVIMMKRI